MMIRQFASVLACGVCVVAMVAPANAQMRNYHIPAGSLKFALSEFGRQSGRSIIYKADQVAGANSPGVNGAMSPDAALAALLAGTAFHAKTDQGGAIAIVSDTTASAFPGAGQGTGSAGTPDAAVAASGGDTTNSDDIVVTAARRTQRLQDVSLAVSAIRTEDLSRTGALRLEDSLIRVPGAAVTNTSAGGGQTRLVIRGLQAAPGGNAVVAAYIDDTPINSAVQSGGGASFPDIDPADMERIEVLRGPQGTLYGASSMGGLIKYVTIAPRFDAISGHIETGFTGVEHGGLGAETRGRINVPLSDKVAVTASGFYRLDPGFIDDVLIGKANYNTATRYGGRVAVLFKPTDDLSIKVSGLHQYINDNATTTVNITNAGAPLLGGNDYYRVSRPAGSDGLKTQFSLADLTVNWAPGGIDLVSDSSFSTQKTIFTGDYTLLVGGVLDTIAGQPAGTLGTVIRSPLLAHKFTQELRFASRSTGFFNLQGGAFYTHEANRNDSFADPILTQTGTAPPPAIAIPPLGYGLLDATYDEIAGFGNVTLKFSDVFQINGGLRYSHNVQHITSTTVGGILLGASLQTIRRSSDNKLTFQVNPELKIVPGILLYGRVASGYRPGGVNFTVVNPATYASDSVTSYEVGAKASLLRDAVTFDLNLFRVDWSHIQVQQRTVQNLIVVQYIGNAGQAKSQGVEFATVVQPIRGLTFDGNLSYTDAKVTTTTLLAAAGSQLPITPRWAGQAGVTYRTAIASGWDASANVSYRYVGNRLNYFATPRFAFPKYDTADVRLGVEHDGFTVDGFIRNITDVRAFTYAAGYGPYTAVSVIQPRTYGMVIGKSF